MSESYYDIGRGLAETAQKCLQDGQTPDDVFSILFTPKEAMEKREKHERENGKSCPGYQWWDGYLSKWD